MQAKRGEVWQIDLGLAQKTRPCVILSVAFLDNERAMVSYVPHTRSVRGTRFEAVFPVRGLEDGAFDAQGIGSISVVKLLQRKAILTDEQLHQVEERVKAWLALDKTVG